MGLSESSSIPLRERIASLRRLSLFADLSSAESVAVFSAANEKRFSRHQTLFCEGDAIRDVMLLLSGCVKITQLGWSGSEAILRLSSKGDLLAETHHAGDFQHGSTAHVIQSGTALVWQAKVFEKLLDSLPVFRRNVVAALEERVREMEHRFRDASSEDVASRLSSELIRLAKRLGDDNCEKEILLSQRELAQLTGTSPFTVNRLLSQWRKLGIVRIRQKAVQVCDRSALALLAARERPAK